MTPACVPRYLVLDAYGVLWQPGRDVEELLIPFLRARGVTLTESAVNDAYRAASLGRFTSTELWSRLGLPGNHDAEYLQGLRLTPGIPALLARAGSMGMPVAVLSNDVREWSLLARTRFGLSGIGHWVIGAEVGLRKPAPAIYRALASATAWPLDQCLFVDDRIANLDTAAALGMQTVLFGPDAEGRTGAHAHTPAPDAPALQRLLGW